MQPHTGLREDSITDMRGRTMPMKQVCRWSDSPLAHANVAVVICTGVRADIYLTCLEMLGACDYGRI